MSDKTLKDKAIDVKGKQYVQVADRIIYFNDNYKEGCIQTTLLSEPTSERVVVRADVFPDGKGIRCFTGHAQEVVGEGYINKTSALENAETSAVGRALAMMGIGVIDSVASVDEINKAKNNEVQNEEPKDTAKAKKEQINKLMLELGYEKGGYSADNVKEETGLDPEPKNYQNIIDTLAAKVIEKRHEDHLNSM